MGRGLATGLFVHALSLAGMGTCPPVNPTPHHPMTRLKVERLSENWPSCVNVQVPRHVYTSLVLTSAFAKEVKWVNKFFDFKLTML